MIQWSTARLGAGLGLVLLSGLACACARGESKVPEERTPTADATTNRPAVVFLGTSLTAGLGLDPEQAYPALVQHKIDAAGLDFRVVNAGVSGETSAGSRRRAEWLLRREPVAVLVIETGANDGLRGLDVDSLQSNVQAVIDRARAARPVPAIVLVGMEAPTNLGRAYTGRFREVYRQLAAANGVPFVPFLLAGVAGVDSLNQADGVHPTAAGQRRMAETVWAVLEPVLRARARARPGSLRSSGSHLD